MLKDKGTYILIECFLEPLSRINSVRSSLGLEEIKVKHFNEYLSNDFITKNAARFFTVKDEVDFGSLYYFTSRVYNACLSKGKPDYFAEINKLAVEITKRNMNEKAIKGYSPEKMLILEKV